ncbi:MAG: putative DNA binding domain-containing protein [Candidatus Aenigmarchaeota archaeon]|nr:putative DNA binding domain-containing protein [Candidatus Aenigmarchaeota archaeon]
MKLEESHTVELKKSVAQMNEALKSVCAFLNHRGGEVYFGVNDKGKITGIQSSDKTLRKISQIINTKIKPEFNPEIKEIKKHKNQIIYVKVPEGSNKPYFSDGIAYIRIGTENRVISPDELKRVILSQKKIKWDEEICRSAKLKDIDEETIKQFLKKAGIERNLGYKLLSWKDVLKRSGMIKNKSLTNALILLFGKTPQKFFPHAEVRCARFKGTEPLEFIDMKVFGSNIISQIENSVEFVKEHMQLHAEIKGMERVEKWEYPIEAVREAIVNAVCHRNYEISGNAQIRIFDDRLEIWGCGTLPEPLIVNDLMKKHDSILRNSLIGKCFFLIRFIEQWGTGTNRMIEECISHELPEPLFEEIAGNLVVTFRKSRLTNEYLEKLELNERQKKSVEYLVKNKKITTNIYADIFKTSPRMARNDLKKLINKEIVKKMGNSKKQSHYVLTEI